ncbi:MAG: cell division protein ZapA [Bacteroidaceae bacterium]|nr:cell division protein ZapA [Bacteroidaceae bacterium]
MAANGGKIQIRLNVGRTVVPLTVPMEKEHIYREAALAIQDKLNRYRTKYPEQGEERYLTIVLLDFAVRALTAEQAADIEPYEQVISKLNEEMARLQAE